MELEPLNRWRAAQPPQQSERLADVLRVGQLYAIDGGVFKARQEEDSRWVLWTWNGKQGHAVTRTGWEIGEFGGLYERVWDVEAEEALVVDGAPPFTVQDLRPVTEQQAWRVSSAMTVEEFAEQLPEIYKAVWWENGRDEQIKNHSPPQ